MDAAFDHLLTERLVIRRFAANDAAGFARYRSLPEVARYQSWEAPYCDTRNEASWRLLERLGFTREGELREAFRDGDGWGGAYLYGRLSAD